MPSSVIRKYSYDAEARELRITFVSGHVYLYAQVPAAVYEGLDAADSRGRYFSQRIRDRYPFRRLGEGGEGPDPAPAPQRPRPGGPASPPPAAAARSAG